MPWRILPALARPRCLTCCSLTPCSASSCKPNRPHRRRPVLGSKSSPPRAENITGIHESPAKPSFPRRDNGTRAAAKRTFHCGCLFPPAALRKPAVQRSNTSATIIPAALWKRDDDDDEEEEIDEERASTAASRAASLERFEYESWTSSSGGILDGGGGDDDGGQPSYFDLPLELIRNTRSNGTDSPVKAAFVFESERKGSRRKIMPSLESSTNRHVKFSKSSSSSTCISPTMQKAREEFHAFLEARAA